MLQHKELRFVALAALAICGCATSKVPLAIPSKGLSKAYAEVLTALDAQHALGKSGTALISALAPHFAPEIEQSLVQWIKSDTLAAAALPDSCGHIDSRGCFEKQPSVSEYTRVVETGIELGCLQWTGQLDKGTTLVRSVLFQRVNQNWRFIAVNSGYFTTPDSSSLSDFQAASCWADRPNNSFKPKPLRGSA